MTASRWIIAGSIFATLVAGTSAKAFCKLSQEGINDYNAGQYRQAVICLAQSIKSNPNDAVVHYYLANALDRIGKHEQAEAEYEIAYRLQPTGQLAEYCKAVLQRYSSVMPVHYGLPNDTKYGGSTNYADGDEISQTESIIQRQALYEKRNSHELGEVYATGFLSQAEQEAKQIQEQAARDLQHAFEPSIVQVGKGVVFIPASPELAKDRADQVRRNAMEEISRTRVMAQNKASQYRCWTRDRENALNEVVSNLESQLEEPTNHSGVKLMAIGTDLYTRYYGATRATVVLPDVHPGVVRIIEHRANAYSIQVPDSGEPGDTTMHSSRSVHGKILN